ncbi:MAG TPA: HNH endonuclease [Anaeromyxobacteraceae bacterium]|nr:HNH endonuclease [Anaeromyxobacteraceae bacterium]
MHANPSSLNTQALAACLRASAGEERDRQVDFLRYLDPFDSREAWREAGYGSLWQYCLSELALREGAAGRRIGAMRVLRQFPDLEASLRDGRLSLTTAVTLRPVLTRENLDEMVARAAFKTDEETRHLVATLQPRQAPKEGIRKLSGPAPRLPAPAPGGAARVDHPEPLALTLPERPPSRPSLDPVSADEWSARLTIDRGFKEELETLKCLLSHKIPDGNLAAVLREAVRCAIEKHGKRRGAVKPEHHRKPATPEPPRPGKRQPIPAQVRRAVFERDGGQCTYVSPDGHRCGSRWQLELDHVRPAALGGPSTTENLRLRCRGHNTLHAEETFGREHMARYRRQPEPRTGESTLAGECALPVTSAAAAPSV